MAKTRKKSAKASGKTRQKRTGAAAAGFGCGFTVFLSKHVAFEASFRTQLVFHPQTEMEHQQEVDTHFALYF